MGVASFRRWAAVALAAALVAVAAIAACLAFPGAAFAKSYTMPEVVIGAQVETDGTLSVTERRTFDFDGDFTCVWWTFEDLPAGAELRVEGVTMLGSWSSGGDLQEVPFQTQWRTSGGPGYGSYSVDRALNTVYVFFFADDEELSFDLRYSITNAVQVYGDVAELYWQYVGPEWAEASRDVDCKITLPVPDGDQIVSGENVRAWGHGPLTGEVFFDGDSVNYEVPEVPSGTFAEARVTFPVEWVPDVDPSEVHSYEALPGILTEEQQWADEANAQRNAARALLAASIIVALALIAWALVMFFRHGKEYKPEFHEDYWRDVPDPAAQPPEIGRLWRWEAESNDDFTAAVMQLAHKGAIRMEKGSYAGARGEVVEDYCMVKVPQVADAIDMENDPLGRTVLDMLFDRFPAGDSGAVLSPQGHVWFGTINKYGTKHPQEFQQAMGAFQATLSRQVDKLGYFELKGSMMRAVMATVAFVAFFAGVILGLLIENFIPTIAAAVAGVVLLVVSHFMTRMTRHGAEVRAKAAALKRWLEDFSALDERPPTDVKVWGEFMVYAFEFGIAEKVMKELRLKVPELFVEETAGSAYMPWWFWYSPHYVHGMGGSLANALSNTVTNTASAASAALSSNSSGGGFGGGFSMGGGGGFGGGGGGAR